MKDINGKTIKVGDVCVVTQYSLVGVLCVVDFIGYNASMVEVEVFDIGVIGKIHPKELEVIDTLACPTCGHIG